ncbi:MAG: pyruvate kinase [Candidatus Magasanikbacteria bacterium CG_4_10_14_0_8_um_filter_32_14]|uniref:Pyruvate kinase n=2 Tax=Candidatus Magasanikiibacteriota TaxID=1752731 RepID=A0A2M7R9J4_9BACT|nr:MAG: pyruvate kinase [Candidatus Magasanikbacteria bacterium CG1_02_32_51]PIY93439.1 MAG: pyruvate kinase [Candidatus Magasanikbacteria bacterium CG_4_10_14_0_8_um_filter_32_14]
MEKQTKIVCTIGPSCEDVDTLEKMVKAGMNIARLNFSHGTYENHKMLIANIRKVEEKTGEPIAILQDLQGPKIRIGKVANEGVALLAGEEVIFSTDPKDTNYIPLGYPELHNFVKQGEIMLLDDGKMQVKIERVVDKKIITKVIVPGILTSNKGINIPQTDLSGLVVLTEKDKQDVRFGIEAGVDMVALSFVMRPDDIIDLRYEIAKCEKELNKPEHYPIRLIAKIEKAEAVKRIKEILDVADGIMVARGDLGIEIPAEEVPIVQKKLIDVALEHAKPVIVATQMLDSMQNNPRPTRAEVSDVANAVTDHTDAVMLSNETASGKYPVEAVTMMTKIIKETEKSEYTKLFFHQPKDKVNRIDDTISGLSRLVAEDVGANLILAASLSGETGRLISRYRPKFPIAVATSSKLVLHQLNLSWGVFPFEIVECQSIEELVERSMTHLKEKKVIKNGDRIIVVAGEPVGHAGHVNLLEVREVK